jgi:tetratricopeptide (TPR) repeat protein
MSLSSRVAVPALLCQIALTLSGQSADHSSVESKAHQAVVEFQKQDFAGARALAREALAASPNNVEIREVEALCSLRLKDYASAAESIKRVLEVKPDATYLLAQLSFAYTRAGMSTERDATRERIRRLSSEGRLPDGFYYVFDTFTVGDKRIEVSEFPKLSGHTEFPNQRYHFDVLNLNDDQLYRIVLASNETDQARWAIKHSAEAAAGLRVFSLDRYDGRHPGPESVYFFYDGEPAYKQVCEQVRQIVLGTSNPISPDQYGRRPEPK